MCVRKQRIILYSFSLKGHCGLRDDYQGSSLRCSVVLGEKRIPQQVLEEINTILLYSQGLLLQTHKNSMIFPFIKLYNLEISREINLNTFTLQNIKNKEKMH